MYHLGDRVRILPYEDSPEYLRNKRKAVLGDKIGTVVDTLTRVGTNVTLYIVHIDGYDVPSSVLWAEAELIRFAEEPKTYDFNITIENNVAAVEMHELCGKKKTFLTRGHGHILHDGAYGIAQAVSYALKHIYRNLEEN